MLTNRSEVVTRMLCSISGRKVGSIQRFGGGSLRLKWSNAESMLAISPLSSLIS